MTETIAQKSWLLFIISTTANTRRNDSNLLSYVRWGKDADDPASEGCRSSPWQLDHPSGPENIQLTAQPQRHSQGEMELEGSAGILLCVLPANERLHYIGWAHTQNDPGSVSD